MVLQFNITLNQKFKTWMTSEYKITRGEVFGLHFIVLGTALLALSVGN